MKMNSLTLVGRRWFNKRKGSTYHSVEIIVNGKEVHKIEYAYGYDNQWEWNAMTWLDKNGYTPDREVFEISGGAESTWRYCDRKGIRYTYTITDVRRKKDL